MNAKNIIAEAVGKKNIIAALLILLFFNIISFGQSKVTPPKEFLGFNVGDDYTLITYSQLTGYWNKLAKESQRMHIEEIGKTEEGRNQIMAIITSPENYKKIKTYKEISKKLALAKNLNDAEAKELSKKGKAVIWIDGGLHATEVVGANQLVEMAYQMVSLNDEETLRILDDVILLLVPANPDGMELVANWYMREKDPAKRVYNNIPRLYQKYIGHDNNRDLYFNSQTESVNMSRIMYIDWFPQIMYNQHQSAPPDLVVYAPPFRDPASYVYDPLLTIGIQSVGVAMHNRLISENKPGSGMRSASNYSIWYNGSLRTTGYYHNQIGMLTEMIGSPTPMEIAFNPDRQLASNDVPFPIAPQEWHFRQSIDYSITLNRAILDYASRNKEILLYNRYLMGKNSIEKGNRDSWTIHPKIVEEVKEKIKKDQELKKDTAKAPVAPAGRGPRIPRKYFEFFKAPENRDPRGYIIPSNQEDFPTAVKFVNALIKSGIKVLKAAKDFEVSNKVYPAGSLVIKTNQAFRPHIIDMFEPQDHPNDFKYENGPPTPPYDNAGWTLAFQMGVKFDRALDGFDGPFEELEGFAKPLAGNIVGKENPKGYLIKYQSNDVIIAVNRLHKEGYKIYWMIEQFLNKGNVYPAGTIFIESKDLENNIFKKLSKELGLSFDGIELVPNIKMAQLQPVKIGLWDRYGGSMESGWTRWILEQFEFPYELVFSKTLNNGELKKKYDILIFVDNAIPQLRTANTPTAPQRGNNPQTASIPAEYRDWLGAVTADTTLPKINQFLAEGGSVVAIGSSTGIAHYNNLPLSNHMVNSKGVPLAREEYYIPASVLQVKINNTLPITFGLPERLDVLFENSPVFRLKPDADKNGITPIAWFDSDKPLRSGWAWGQDKLYGGVTMAEAKVGNGNLYLFGPEILFRGQSHGTFKLLFNAIYLSNIKNKP